MAWAAVARVAAREEEEGGGAVGVEGWHGWQRAVVRAVVREGVVREEVEREAVTAEERAAVTAAAERAVAGVVVRVEKTDKERAAGRVEARARR